MTRKSIFEMLNENDTINDDANRLIRLFESEPVIRVSYSEYTLLKYVRYYCFDHWKARKHCLDTEDFLKTIRYSHIKALSHNIEFFLILIEIIFNFWKLADNVLKNDKDAKYYANFNLLFDIMADCLAKYNHKAVYDETTEQMLVVEDKPELTAVAEITEPELAISMIRYNHYSLKGDLQQKKAILLSIGADLESKRKNLHNINSTLEDHIFFMYNNLNLRHNNLDKIEAIEKSSKFTLEEWYDELYQMTLLAYLEIDQQERNQRVRELKLELGKSKT